MSSAQSKSVCLSCFHLMPYTGLVTVFLPTKSMMRRNKNGESTQACRVDYLNKNEEIRKKSYV